jgi:hypothetical protein
LPASLAGRGSAGIVAYSEELVERIRDVLDGRPGIVERKMFGGVAWMVNGNMACGVIAEDRFLLVEAAGIEERDLVRWIETGANFAESLPPK